MTTPNNNGGKIHLAMAAIISDIDKIGKDRKNEQQGFRFRGIDDCYNALHPIFAAHGVVCIPSMENMTTADVGKNSKGNSTWRTHVTMAYRFIADDGSSVEAKTIGEGMDYGDKSTAKAMSVAHKYLLIQTFLIPTADIPDADFYSPTSNPREDLANLKAEEKTRALQAIIEEKRKMSMEAATDADKKRLQAEASDLQAQLDNEEGQKLADARQQAQEPAVASAVPTVTDHSPEVLPPEDKAPKQNQPHDWRSATFGHLPLKTNHRCFGKSLGELFETGDLTNAQSIMATLTKENGYMTSVAAQIAAHAAGKAGPPHEKDQALYDALLCAKKRLLERLDELPG